MSRIIYERFREICPDEDISNKSIDDLITDTNVAFKIIGYEPKNIINLEDNVRKIYDKVDNDTRLYVFIYKVWRWWVDE